MEKKTLSINGNKITFCPCCGQTASLMESGYECSCPFCGEHFYFKDNTWFKLRDHTPAQKKYDPIIDKLTAFSIEQYETPIVYLTDQQRAEIDLLHCTFSYESNGKTAIGLKANMNQTERIISLAHEIGHAINFVDDFKRNSEMWRSTNTPSVSLMREHIAWEHSLDLLHRFGFTDWSAFIVTVSKFLGTYYYHEYEPFRRTLKYRPSMPPQPRYVFIKKLIDKINKNVFGRNE